jgi:hypothetical protein
VATGIAPEAAHTLKRAADLHVVLAALERVGIDALAFKGPTLAALLYERLDRVASGDLDVLVRRADIERAVAALAAVGYRPDSEVALSLPGNNEMLLRCEGRADVDLHWALSPPYFFPFDLDGAFGRAQTVRLIGQEFRTLGNEDLFVGLVIHHSRHCWDNAGWIRDIALLLEKRPLDWALVERAATVARARRAVNLAILLTGEAASSLVPQRIRDRAHADRVAGRIAEQIRRNHREFRGDFAGTTSGAVMQMRMTESIADRLRYIVWRALLPNQTDATSAPNGRSSTSMTMLRPLRVLSKALTARGR